MFSIVDHQRQAAMVSDYIASKRVTREQYLKTNHSLRLGIAGPPGKYGLFLYVRIISRQKFDFWTQILFLYVTLQFALVDAPGDQLHCNSVNRFTSGAY